MRLFLVCFLMVSTAAVASPVIEVVVTGTIDAGFFTPSAPFPEGVGIGTSYRATLRYDTAQAGPDSDASLSRFSSALDVATTDFVVEAAGKTWTLPAPTAGLNSGDARHVLGRIETYGLFLNAPSDGASFPGSTGGTNTIVFSVSVDTETGASLWLDPVAAVVEHISREDQIDVDVAGGVRQFEFGSANGDDDRWYLSDDDATVVLSVKLGAVDSGVESWSHVKRRYGSSDPDHD